MARHNNYVTVEVTKIGFTGPKQIAPSSNASHGNPWIGLGFMLLYFIYNILEHV